MFDLSNANVTETESSELDPSRRNFLIGTGIAALGTLASSYLPSLAQSENLYPIYRKGAYVAKDFSHLCRDSKLGLSPALLEHHLGLYKGYVDKVNAAELYFRSYTQGDIDANHSKNLAFALNGMILHDIYFTNMTSSKSSRSRTLNKALEESFGSFDNYINNLVNIAKQSKGWSLTCYNLINKKLINYGLANHSDNFPNFVVPILALDVYEHAYDKDFGLSTNGKDKYIEVFRRIIDWDIVGARLRSCD